MESSESRSYGGAHAVSGIFKFAAVLVLIGGVVSAISLANHNSSIGNSQNTGGEVAGIIGGAIFVAASVLFFAYVLDLLIGIQENTARSALTATSATDFAEPKRRAPVYPEPGWYEDPDGTARARLWDGREWTDRTQT
jgi:hypothetical protein